MTIGHPFSTRRGRKVREAYRRAEPLCEPCRRNGIVREMDEVHHVVPVSQGGAPYDRENFESRCEDCHKQAHGSTPKGGTDPATGLPTGDHWWCE